MFDSPGELLRKIRLGEDTSLELKRVAFRGDRLSEPRRDDLADEIAAIANTADGAFVFGVDDQTREILGMPIDRLDTLERTVFEICTQTIRPAVLFRSYRMELPDSSETLRAILKVEIPRSLFVHESPGGYLHRQGSSKRKMAPDVLARLFQQRSQARILRFEEQAVPETGFSDLDERLWQRFLGPQPGEPIDKLRKLSLLTFDDSGHERATVAGVLMCSQAPERWLPSAYIEAVRYRGVKQDSHYQLDAQRITGPLDQQVRFALLFARRNMSVFARKNPGRIETPQFSIRALFEAIVNAVAHRDYSIHGSKIRLLQFDDRLELYSPGALPNTVTVESLPLRQSTRNELLTTLLSRSPVDDPNGETGRQFYMEKRGDGVPIILDESRKLSGRDPEYRLIDDAELLLTIYAAMPPGE
jgi:predicted HTH transcriptional regulator